MLKIIDDEVELLGDPSKIFIGGFAQGSVTALATFLKYKGDIPLGGVIALSGMQGLDHENQVVFKSENDRQRISEMRKKIPMFAYYGEDDNTFKAGKTTQSYLRYVVYEHSTNYTFLTEEGLGHKISLQEKELLKEWLDKHMSL